MVKHRQLAPTVGHIAKNQQKNSMTSFDFSFPAIDPGTTFVFGSWVCIADGTEGFSSHLINPTSARTPRLEQLGKITSAKILLPGTAKEIGSLSLLDPTPTRFPFGLRNSAMSYSALFHQGTALGLRLLPGPSKTKKAGDDATAAKPLAERMRLLELSALQLRMDRETCGVT
jgi:hypothetical protein